MFLYRKDLDAFLTKRYGVSSAYKKFWCFKCITNFKSPEKLREHKLLCVNKNAQVLEYPTKDEVLKFSNYDRQYRNPLTG